MADVGRLTEPQIALELNKTPQWRREGTSIAREIEFPSFRAAIAFVNRVADAAEAIDHHPDIDVRYRRVTFRLSTHSAGGLTEKDFALAAKIDGDHPGG